MKKWMLCLALIFSVATVKADVLWLTDATLAKNYAKTNRRIVLMDFTGSDWCGWCMKLKSEVFNQPEFAAYAKENLVMVEVDFPRHKPQSDEQREANEKLQSTYGIQGFPTIVVLDSNGKHLGNLGYTPGGPSAFITELENLPGVGHFPPGNVAAAKAAMKPTAATPAAPAAPAFVPVPPEVPNKYGDMALKGISGAKGKRFALINNVTLMTGESGKVKVHDQRVDVTVKEIRDDSVLIAIDGKTSELKLAER